MPPFKYSYIHNTDCTDIDRKTGYMAGLKMDVGEQ